MEKEKVRFPREVTIIPADNGYIGKIGCKWFVVEGDKEKATSILSRYLGLDESIVKEMDYTGKDAFHEDHPVEGECEKEEKLYRPTSPAYSYLASRSESRPRKISSVFQAHNGKIEVFYNKRTAVVTQREVDPEEDGGEV